VGIEKKEECGCEVVLGVRLEMVLRGFIKIVILIGVIVY
jgi:hypothetical protein